MLQRKRVKHLQKDILWTRDHSGERRERRIREEVEEEEARDQEETHKTVNLMTPQQHEREGIFIGLFIEFQLNLPGPSFHSVALVSSCQQSSPQICAFRINDNSTQVSWRPVAPNDLMHTVEVLTQQRVEAPFKPEVPSVSHEVAQFSSCTKSKTLGAHF